MKKMVILALTLILFTGCTSTDTVKKEARKEALKTEVKQILVKLQQAYNSGELKTLPVSEYDGNNVVTNSCDEYSEMYKDASCIYSYDLVEENGKTKASFSIKLIGKGDYLGLDASSYNGEEPTAGEIAPIE